MNDSSSLRVRIHKKKFDSILRLTYRGLLLEANNIRKCVAQIGTPRDTALSNNLYILLNGLAPSENLVLITPPLLTSNDDIFEAECTRDGMIPIARRHIGEFISLHPDEVNQIANLRVILTAFDMFEDTAPESTPP